MKPRQQKSSSETKRKSARGVIHAHDCTDHGLVTNTDQEPVSKDPKETTIDAASYREIFDNAVEGIFRTTPNGRYIAVNPAMARIYGCASPEELINSTSDITSQVYVEPSRRAEFKRLLEEHGVVYGFEHEAFRRDGSKIWISVNARAIRDDRGQVLYYEGTVLDTTDRRQAQEDLRESEERYRELFENSRDAIYVHDLGGRYVSVNHAAEKLTGFRRDEILGKQYSNFVAPRNLKDARENFCRKLDVPVETTYEAEVVCKNGVRKQVEVSSRMIYKDGVAIGVQGIARDISERKRADEVLHAYSHRLIEAQEAERENVTIELRDEIGQVLTAVRMNLQSVLKSCRTDQSISRIDESIEVIDEALARVRELSLELRRSPPDDLGLPAALRWYAALYTLRSGIAAEVSGDSEVGRISHDVETACFQIAQEALTNSARHAAATRASVRIERQNGQLCLTISDNGSGFDAERYLNGVSSASALGLRGMRERALAVRGHVEIISSPAKGTQIVVRVPLSK
jgi:PAS domain S-box-containing protein